MFHEVLVIPYIKICEFSAAISQLYFGILLECSFGLGSSQETNTNHPCKNITLTKDCQTVQDSSPKNYAVIHKTLITASLFRRFKFVSVCRSFVICDFKLLRDKLIGRLLCEKSLSSLLFA